MDNNDELYSLVKEAIRKIRERSDKPTPSLVCSEVKKNRQKVLQTYAQIMGQEEQEKRNREASAISHSIGTAILKDRDEHANKLAASLNETIERLNETCALLGENIVEMQDEKETLEHQLISEREAHTEIIQSHVLSGAKLEGTRQAMGGQINNLQEQLETAQKKRDDAIKEHSELHETLVQRNAEANIHGKQLDEMKTERDKALVDLNASEMAKERQQGQFTEVRGQLEQAQKALKAETDKLIEAEKLSAAATARLEEIRNQSLDHPEREPASRTTANKASKAKKNEVAASNN